MPFSSSLHIPFQLSIPIPSRLLDSTRTARRDIRSFHANKFGIAKKHRAPHWKSTFLSIQRPVVMTSRKNMIKGGSINGDGLLQILALLGSGLSMIAIIILLKHFNNQPIFDWNGVTLNAIVAVFSAISKAMLVYALSECLGQAKWIWFSSQSRSVNDIEFIDSSSRGPLGSFQMLTKSVARSFISMGAIMIILSVTIDPFVQLTVGQKDDLKFENKSTVQIAYAKRYAEQGFSYDSTEKIAVGSDGDLRVETAVFESLFRPDSFISQQTQHSCPTENCTWDTFTSLAICSGCNNVTDQLKQGDFAVLFPEHFNKSTLGYYLPNDHIGNFDNHKEYYKNTNT